MSSTLSGVTHHLARGGAAILNHPARYGVADGAVIPPARYAGRNGSEFVFERRYVDGAPCLTALIDSKQSQSNRSEEGLIDARERGDPASRIPMVAVDYPSGRQFDATLPHRIFDAHVRGASENGTAVVQTDWYRALRDATFTDLSALFTVSPVTLAFGGWDSTRNRGQFRMRSHFVSELYAVVPEPEDRLSRRSGARLDPLGQDFHITPDEFEELLDRQAGQMSAKTVQKLRGEVAKARKADGATVSAAALGLGGVPPGTETPYGVSVPEVLRARTYSLAGLRRLRFGGSGEEDVAARAALLAVLLLSAAYADADPAIRAYCDLTAPASRVLLDDEEVDFDLSIEACEAYLSEAIEALPSRLEWTGQLVRLEGDPALDRGATAHAEE